MGYQVIRQDQDANRMRLRLPRSLVRTIAGVILLSLIFGSFGIAYVYWSDRVNHTYLKPATNNSDQQFMGMPAPKKISPNVPESVAVDTVVSPVKIGMNSSITVTTNPDSTCNIQVSYNGQVSKDSGLVPKTADAYGSVTWSWSVDSSAPVGSWPIIVNCAYHNHSAVVDSNIQVTK